MSSYLVPSLLRWAVSAVVLMLAVGWVTPKNAKNTFVRALVISLLLAAAWNLTLARFLWPLVIPWALYAIIWIIVVKVAYDLRFFSAILLAVAQTIVSFLISLLFNLQRL